MGLESPSPFVWQFLQRWNQRENRVVLVPESVLFKQYCWVRQWNKQRDWEWCSISFPSGSENKSGPRNSKGSGIGWERPVPLWHFVLFVERIQCCPHNSKLFWIGVFAPNGKKCGLPLPPEEPHGSICIGHWSQVSFSSHHRVIVLPRQLIGDLPSSFKRD